jgi:hypothetical protein
MKETGDEEDVTIVKSDDQHVFVGKHAMEIQKQREIKNERMDKTMNESQNEIQNESQNETRDDANDDDNDDIVLVQTNNDKMIIVENDGVWFYH